MSATRQVADFQLVKNPPDVAYWPKPDIEQMIKQSLDNDFEPRIIEKYLAGRDQANAARLRPQ